MVSKAGDVYNHRRRLVGSTSLTAEGNCYHVEAGFDTTQMGKSWNINVHNQTNIDGVNYKLGLQLLEAGNRGVPCSQQKLDDCETDVAINGEIEVSTRTVNDCECYYTAALVRDDVLNNTCPATEYSNNVRTTISMGVRKTYEKVDFAALALSILLLNYKII